MNLCLSNQSVHFCHHPVKPSLFLSSFQTGSRFFFNPDQQPEYFIHQLPECSGQHKINLEIEKSLPGLTGRLKCTKTIPYPTGTAGGIGKQSLSELYITHYFLHLQFIVGFIVDGDGAFVFQVYGTAAVHVNFQ